MKRRAVGPWIWILGLQLLLVLPFIAQPLHIDDPIYLNVGRHALKAPFHADDFPFIFEGVLHSDMASHSHPPFVGYWIGLLLFLTGDGPNVQYALHLGFLIFPLLFAAGMYLLAMRFTAMPDLAAAVAITSPAAIVMSHTLMTDIPTLALSTLGMALFVKGVDEERSTSIWMSGILLALASFSSYPALLLSGVCWFYFLIRHSRIKAGWWAPAIAPLWILFWWAYEYIHFGRFVLSGTARYVVDTGGFGLEVFANKFVAFPIFLAGSVLLLPMTFFREMSRGAIRIFVALLWAVASVGLAYDYTSNYSFSEKCLVALFMTLGGWTLLGLMMRIKKLWSGDMAFLSLWLVAAVAPVLLLYTSGMSRYLLPFLPPLVLIAFQKLSSESLPSIRFSAMISIVAGVALGLLLSAADFDMSRIHRDAAMFVGRQLNGWKDHGRFGAEWGLGHYLLEQGFRQYTVNATDLSGGDFIISPAQAVPYALPQDVASMLVPVSQKTWTSSIPIRLMNQEAHAGFYSSNWGLLPFSISNAPVETMDLKQVSYLVENLPESAMEGKSDQAAAIPVPAPAGGVDVVLPGDSKLTIPYSGPVPAQVQFECVGSESEVCPMRVHASESDISLRKTGDVFQFDLNARGDIVLEAHRPLTIRNWLMLPKQ